MAGLLRGSYTDWSFFPCCDVLVCRITESDRVCWSCGEDLGINLATGDIYGNELTLALKAASSFAGVKMVFSHGPNGYV